MSDKLRIVFAGTPDFSVPTLKILVESRHEVVGVFTQPDRPAGRGRKLRESPVKKYAVEQGIPVFQPAKLKSAEEQQPLHDLQPDLMVVVAYGLILPEAVLNAPKMGCLNVHASLLPRWRGAAPIQRAILAGDHESGVTIMQMDVGLDTGDMLFKVTTPISADDTGSSLHDRLSIIGADALLEAIDGLLEGKITPEKQDEAEVTYAEKLQKQEAQIDWQLPAAQIARLVHAFNAWPVAFTHWGEHVLRIWLAEAFSIETNAAPGTVIEANKKGIDVACGEGILRIKQLQMPGKKPVAVPDFLNAHSISGEQFK